MGWARVQATSRGGHGDEAHYNRRVLYGAKALTSNRVLPHCEGRRTLETGPEAVENKVSTTPSARAAPHRGGFSVGLKRPWLHDAASFKSQEMENISRSGSPPHSDNRGVLYGAEALTSNRVLPHCEGRRTDVTGPEAVENEVSTTPHACGTTPRRFQCGPLAPLAA